MRKINESITCDTCGKELITDTPYPHNFHLELKSIDTNRNTSGMTYAVHMEAPINGSTYFCDNKCLITFLNK